MTRVKNSVATRARRKKVLKRASGYFGSKHRLYKTANEQVQDGWKLLTFSITNTAKAILVFYTEENQG